jgi:hypothetical protein
VSPIILPRSSSVVSVCEQINGAKSRNEAYRLTVLFFNISARYRAPSSPITLSQRVTVDSVCIKTSMQVIHIRLIKIHLIGLQQLRKMLSSFISDLVVVQTQRSECLYFEMKKVMKINKEWRNLTVLCFRPLASCWASLCPNLLLDRLSLMRVYFIMRYCKKTKDRQETKGIHLVHAQCIY